MIELARANRPVAVHLERIDRVIVKMEREARQ